MGKGKQPLTVILRKSPEVVDEYFTQMKQILESTVHTIGVLSALADVEHPAVLVAFGIDPTSEPTIVDGGRYWETDIALNENQKHHIVISCIGGSGNVAPSIPVERMVREHKPEIMFLVGIACGLRSCKLGDVVTSENIWAYEYVKNTKDKRFERSRSKSCPQHIVDDINQFSAHREWHERFADLTAKFPSHVLPSQPVIPALHPSIWIASGEKVMGNGELVSLNAQHDKIRAAEMEGYGFAHACDLQSPRVSWLVIRGISDYGDATKDGKAIPSEESGGAHTPKKDEYHVAAALSAATFLRTFLERSYIPVSSAYESRKNEISGTLSDRQIKAMAGNGLLISKEFSEDGIKEACYELRIGDTYLEMGEQQQIRSTNEFGNVLLKPRQFTVIITKEELNIPEYIIGRILTKGQLFSVGILPVNTYADPGFKGQIGIVFYNATPQYLQIPKGTAIAKIEFSTLSEPVERPYSGQHGYQSKVWPIPTGIIISDAVASGDARVSSKRIEFERSYGRDMPNIVGEARKIACFALWIAVASILISVLTFLRK